MARQHHHQVAEPGPGPPRRRRALPCRFLYDEELLIRSGARRNEPYARWVASGHFEVKTRLVGDDLDRPPVARSTTYVTPKGEDLIWARLHRAGLVAAPVPLIRQLELT
ncbi:phage antirepressor KilAC domain-containing protein [Streptomyces sp. NPDC047968]|uniref:phage antirepressor KilAC domain-containing protein n=1 Tax=unclassified Streptomyces TaxID=2593676 RepID=UPI00342D37B3